MTQIRITKRDVDAATPRGSRYTLFDSGVAGFGLRVFPSGAKSWILEYRAGEGGRSAQKRRFTIGHATDLTPDQARREADKLRAKVKTGSDPQGSRSAQRAAPTLEEVADAFLDVHMAKRATATRAEYARALKKEVLPRFRSRKAKDITSADIVDIHHDKKTTPYAANRLLAIISSMYSWASGPSAPKSVRLPAGTNPVKGIERYEEAQRGRLLTSDELERLGAAIRLAETEGLPWSINAAGKIKHVPKTNQSTVIGAHAIAAIRLLIFTGARLREILHLTWDDIDWDRGIVVIRQHKTVRTNGVKAIVLNAPALEVLSGLERVGKFVIAGDTAGSQDEKPRSDLKRPWDLIRTQAGLNDLRIHDLRHNFGGFGASGGAGLYIVGKLLGHSPKNPQTTARYSHLDNDPLRRASNSIGAALAAALGESPNRPDVIHLPTTRTRRT